MGELGEIASAERECPCVCLLLALKKNRLFCEQTCSEEILARRRYLLEGDELSIVVDVANFKIYTRSRFSQIIRLKRKVSCQSSPCHLIVDRFGLSLGLLCEIRVHCVHPAEAASSCTHLANASTYIITFDFLVISCPSI